MLNIFKSQNNAFNFPYTKDSFTLYKQIARQYKDKDIISFVNRIVQSEIKEEIRIKKKCQNCNMSIMHLNVFKGNSWRLRMIEVYECFNCNLKIVFPRYGEITKIADSRIGRCSESSMLFGAILNSLSIETRIVQDYLDHCWNESLIDDKWINIDSTLEYPISINHPHYYEKNWSKKYKYILAFSHNSLEDVTSSYTQDWQIVLQRRRKDNKGRNMVEYFRKFY